MLKMKIKLYIRKILEFFPVQQRHNIARYLNFILSMLGETFDVRQQQMMTELIECSISASNSGDYEKAEGYLLKAAMLNPTNHQIAPHLGRIRFLKSRSVDSIAISTTQSMLATINLMNHEIESNPIYVPGEFWKGFGQSHLQLLERYGIENFKRTVSHYYQNWLMCSLDDPQVIQLFNTWPKHFASEPWFNIIEIPDHVGANPSMENPINHLVDAGNREIYRISVGLLWEYVKDNDSFNILEKMNESEIGNPIRIWRKGKLISSDLAHSVRERNMLFESLSISGNEQLVVGELGAGHGRLAEVFGRSTNFRYFIFDITPALFVSQWYIKSLFPNEKIFEFRHFDDFEDVCDNLKECRFAFFTSNQIEKFPSDFFDLFINMNSLAEMRSDQIHNFLHYIDKITSGSFLSRQQLDSCNPVELVPLSKNDFSMPNRWRLLVDKVDDIHPEYFNQIWKKTSMKPKFQASRYENAKRFHDK